MSSPVKEYLNMLAEASKGTPHHAKFYEWEAGKTRRLKIVSYTSNPRLKAIIDQAFGANKHGSIRANQCFHNALLSCFADRDIEYVEGYIIVCGIPLEHSWNHWKGIDFDLTQEVLLQRALPHYEILSLNAPGVRFWASELGTTGPYRQDYFYTNVSTPPIPYRKKQKKSA